MLCSACSISPRIPPSSTILRAPIQCTPPRYAMRSRTGCTASAPLGPRPRARFRTESIRPCWSSSKPSVTPSSTRHWEQAQAFPGRRRNASNGTSPLLATIRSRGAFQDARSRTAEKMESLSGSISLRELLGTLRVRLLVASALALLGLTGVVGVTLHQVFEESDRADIMGRTELLARAAAAATFSPAFSPADLAWLESDPDF